MSREEPDPVEWCSGKLVLNQCPGTACGNTDTAIRTDMSYQTTFTKSLVALSEG